MRNAVVRNVRRNVQCKVDENKAQVLDHFGNATATGTSYNVLISSEFWQSFGCAAGSVLGINATAREVRAASCQNCHARGCCYIIMQQAAAKRFAHPHYSLGIRSYCVQSVMDCAHV